MTEFARFLFVTLGSAAIVTAILGGAVKLTMVVQTRHAEDVTTSASHAA